MSETVPDFEKALDNFISVNEETFKGVDLKAFMNEVRERDESDELLLLERAVITAALCYREAEKRHMSEIEIDSSGQLRCGTTKLLNDLANKFRAAVDALEEGKKK